MGSLDEVVPCVHKDILERIGIAGSPITGSKPGMGFWLPAKRMALSQLCETLAFFRNEGEVVNMKRRDCEENFSYRHFATYTILHLNAYYLYNYSRGKSGTEDRLHAKRSIGIGGHVTMGADEEGEHSHLTPDFLHVQAAREVYEEVVISNTCTSTTMSETLINSDLKYHGLLCYPPETPVDAVHVGLVFGLNVALFSEGATIMPREDCLDDFRTTFFNTIDQFTNWENWSNFLLRYVIQPVHIHKLIP